MSDSYDIFINTTNVDNTPVSVMEAMALGLPVVSTDAGGVPFLFRNEKEGLLTEIGNTEEMVSAIERLLENNEKTESMSMAARNKALHWDWNAVAPQWKQLLIEAGEKNEYL